MKSTSVSFPSFIEPMKALLLEKLPEGDWLYEVKLDALTMGRRIG
jgi:ATP-dependent DNA ligase